MVILPHDLDTMAYHGELIKFSSFSHIFHETLQVIFFSGLFDHESMQLIIALENSGLTVGTLLDCAIAEFVSITPANPKTQI